MIEMKVAWICHFSNATVREKLPLADNGKSVADFAPWISNLLEEFKGFGEVELHVISPHVGLSACTFSFELDSIHYHFFKADYPFTNKYLVYLCHMAESHTGYLRNRMLVHSLIAGIRPDIINLMGAENAYYSSAVLDVTDIPKIITVQGIYSNPERFKLLKKDSVRYSVERKIHKQNRYFGVSACFMPDLIKRDAADPVLFWNRFPLKILKTDNASSIAKQYDFVFFARLEAVKGPDDALDALALVKKYQPQVTMRMMGPLGSSPILEELHNKSRALGLENNLRLSAGYALQEEMLKEAARAKYYVLPTKIDTIPGTIFEAIYLGLPVVSYRTGDIPLLNKGATRLLLCDKGDIAALANNMASLLSDPQLGPDLSRKARAFVEKWFDNRKLAYNLVEQYRAVQANFHHEVPIPPHLLYENYLNDL